MVTRRDGWETVPEMPWKAEERYEREHRRLQRAVFVGWFLGFLAFTLFVALLAR